MSPNENSGQSDLVRFRRYQLAVERFVGCFDRAEVVYNRMHRGRNSGVRRMVEVLVRGTVSDMPVVAVAECHQHGRWPLHEGCVEQFVSVLDDVGAGHGVLFSCTGFSAPALARAASARWPGVLAVSLDYPETPGGIVPRQRRTGERSTSRNRSLRAEDVTELDYSRFVRGLGTSVPESGRYPQAPVRGMTDSEGGGGGCGGA